MSTTVACPECGAEVKFSAPGSVLSVCSYCKSVVAKRGIDYKKLGKVAELAVVPSPLRLGLRGRAHGGYTVVGRLQLDHGAGTWNEWYLALDNGRWLWLAETQGRYYLSMPLGPVAKVPPFESLRVGHTLPLPVEETEQVLKITEVHTAKIVSAEGELPFEVSPGESVRYADLSGAKGKIGTLDFGASGTSQVLGFYGHKIRLDSLRLEPASCEDPAPRVARAGTRMSCPQCDGALALRAPDSSLRVTCPYCRALIDVSAEPLRALMTLKAPPAHLRPILALGKKGKLRDREYTVIGHLRREIVKGGSGFWDEYLLLTDDTSDSAFHYLIYSGGHFTLASPINYGDISFGPRRVYDGLRFRLVEKCTTQVSYINGEFPWAVAVGETVLVEDNATSGVLLSIETTVGQKQEVNATVGYYLDSDEVYGGFALEGKPPKKDYVAPHQPNPYEAAYKRRKRILVWATLAMALLLGWSCTRDGRHSQDFRLRTLPGAEPGAEQIVLSEPFDIGQKGQSLAVSLSLAAEVDNSWVAADVSLINEEDGQVFSVPLEAAYYSGYEGGEHWSEGSKRVTAVIPKVPGGRYVARIEPSWPLQKTCSYTRDCGGTFICEAGKCSKHCVDLETLAYTEDNDAQEARRALERLGTTNCGSGFVCRNSQCVLAEVDMKVHLAYPTTRWAYAFWLWLLMALVPGFTLWRLRAFEQRRTADNG